MIKIAHAQVEILDKTQARPVGKTVLSVTIGDHVFDIQVDESELIDALASALDESEVVDALASAVDKVLPCEELKDIVGARYVSRNSKEAILERCVAEYKDGHPESNNLPFRWLKDHLKRKYKINCRSVSQFFKDVWAGSEFAGGNKNRSLVVPKDWARGRGLWDKHSPYWVGKRETN